MRIAIITSGAAGMFCGSCMKDNTLASALIALGHETLLLPTYTPVTTDESDLSNERVFFGGVNVYLQQKWWSSWLFRYTPKFIDALLNNRRFLRWVGRFAGSTDYSKLGALTESMLAGTHGNQRKEVFKLIDWLKADFPPDVVIMSNALLSGVVPAMKAALNVPIFTTLQGDDIFLDGLPERDRVNCIARIRENDAATTGYIATSKDYADRMSVYLGVNRAKVHVVYPGIQHKAYEKSTNDSQTINHPDEPPGLSRRSVLGNTTSGINPEARNDVVDNRNKSIGYFARLAPEKGFHNIVDAFLTVRTMPGLERTRLQFGGWLGKRNHAYFHTQLKKLTDAGADFTHVDCPDLKSKAKFFQTIDVMSVPTDYQECKGLSILEAWASGVPVVQPRHGSFPELIEATGGGLLVPPGDNDALAEALARLLRDPDEARSLGQLGQAGVREKFSAERMAQATLEVLQRV